MYLQHNTPPSTPIIHVTNGNEGSGTLKGTKKSVRPTSLTLAEGSGGVGYGGLPELEMSEGQMRTNAYPDTNNPAQLLYKSIEKKPLSSPCFVHSHLERGASFADWLRNRNINDNPVHSNALDNKMVQSLQSPSPSTSDSSPINDSDDLDDDDNLGSLTRQLAQTAAGVREMSRQLGIHLLLPPNSA